MLGNLNHTVRLDEARTGRTLWQSSLGTLLSLTWERKWNATSVAKLTLNVPPHVKDMLEPWQYLVSIYANEQLAWHGVVYRTTATRSALEVVAHDGSTFWEHRRVAQGRSYLNVDATQVARDLVTDAMGVNDPTRMVTFMQAEAAGVWVTKETVPGTRFVDDEMKELVDAGLSWSVVSGRLVFGPLVADYRTQPLQDQDWDAEVAVVKDGAEVVTDMLIMGSGVYGYYIDNDQTVGMLQGIEKADALVREGECEALAERRVMEARFPLRTLELSGDSRLLPSAPVTLDELVPGVIVPVSSSQTGVTVAADMMLESVEVTDGPDGDAVSIKLVDKPSALAPELVAPMVPEDYDSPYDKERKEKEMQSPRGGAGSQKVETPGQAPVV